MRGYHKLAHFVETDLRKDLVAAKAERNIPLAGNEEEQAKVMGRDIARPEAAAPAPTETPPAAEGPTSEPVSSEGAGGEEQAVEVAIAPPESMVGEVSVIRPVITPTTLEAARSLSTQAATTAVDSEIIKSELPGGLTAVATISAVTDLSLSSSSRPRLPLNQRPYYKVLVKGEQLKPKSGRADDFTWSGG
jgi:hypothetical protein